MYSRGCRHQIAHVVGCIPALRRGKSWLNRSRKLADFFVLDQNPHAIPIEKLADLKVLQTIKEGKTIYTAP